ncbi:PH domain-containing protein [Salipaludibacillus neizhouensis]|nr:PH domain-containing protein [Salipaludibacillus neizhouensis]
MRPTPDQALDERTLTVWKIAAAIGSILYFVFPAAYWGALKFWEFPDWIFYALIFVAILFALINIFFIQKLQWSRWRYKIYDNEVELMHGVFVVRRVIIPMIRVQHVDTRQGPIMRYYKLASVTISTAATTHEIPGLSLEKAGTLRDHIAQLAREADPNE